MTAGAPQSAMAEWRRYGIVPIAAGIGYSTMAIQTYGIGPFVAPRLLDLDRPVHQPSMSNVFPGRLGARRRVRSCDRSRRSSASSAITLPAGER